MRPPSLLVRVEFERQRIDTVALIRGSAEAFASEYVTQVATTIGARHFGAGHTKRIVGCEHHCARDSVVKTRPPALRVELRAAFEQFGTTCATGVGTRVKHAVVFATKRWFGAALA